MRVLRLLRVVRELERLLRVEAADPLAPGVEEHHGRVAVDHAVRVAAGDGEDGHPAVGALLGHAHVARELVGLLARLEDRHERVRGAERVPRPVVRVEARAVRIVHLPVEAAVVASVLGDVHHALVDAPERRVEDGPLVLGAALHLDLRERAVPGVARGGGEAVEVEVRDLGAQVALGLLGGDVGDAHAHPHGLGLRAEEQHRARAGLPHVGGRRVELGVEVHAHGEPGARGAHVHAAQDASVPRVGTLLAVPVAPFASPE